MPLNLIYYAAAGFFVLFVDSLTPQGYLDWFAYWILVFFATKNLKRKEVYLLTVLYTVFIFIGILISPEVTHPLVALHIEYINRILGTLVLWFIAYSTLVRREEFLRNEQLRIQLQKKERDLISSTRKTNEIIERISDLFLGFDKDLNFTYINKHAIAIGYHQKSLARNLFEEYPDYKNHIMGQKFLEALNTQQPLIFEAQGVLSHEWFHISLYPSTEGLSVFALNITEKRKAMEEILRAHQVTEDIVNSISDAFYALDKNWKIVFVNEMALLFFKRKREDIIDKNILEIPGIKGSYLEELIQKVMQSKKKEQIETPGIFSPEKMFLINVYPSKEGVSIFISDITERKNTERKLNQALKEKEMLLKEVYHRVKNNLQLITSILGLQAESSDEKIKNSLREIINRINSISLLHARLYHGDNIDTINSAQYIKEVADTLAFSYSRENIQMVYKIDEFNLDVKIATYLGILINEFVSNSFKHAFPQKRSGKIYISLSNLGNNAILYLKDNGIGFKQDLVSGEGSSLGFRLVNLLSLQLEGEAVWKNTYGTSLCIRFPIG